MTLIIASTVSLLLGLGILAVVLDSIAQRSRDRRSQEAQSRAKQRELAAVQAARTEHVELHGRFFNLRDLPLPEKIQQAQQRDATN